MKKLIFFCIVIMVMAMQVYAQGVAINSDGTSPDNSAVLDVKSPTIGLQMGILFPRVNLANAFNGGAATHLFGVNTNSAFNAGSRFNSGLGLYRFDGTRWNRLLESTDSTMFWGTRGNAIVAGDFLGTTTDEPLVIKTGSTQTTRLTIPDVNSGIIVAENIRALQLPAGSYLQPSLRFSNSTMGIYGSSTFLGIKTPAVTMYMNPSGGVRFSQGSEQTADANIKIHADGNIYTTEKFVYSEANASIAGQLKTAKLERVWSGTVTTTPATSAVFYRESVTSGLQLRVTRDVGGYTLEAVALGGCCSGWYSCNGNAYNLSSWNTISTPVNGVDQSYVYHLTKQGLPAGNNTNPFYRITLTINGNIENVRMLVEGWHNQP